MLFLSCEILLKWFGCQSRTFFFSTLERITMKQTGHHVCLLHVHAHVYKIHVSICHASDTGQNYLNKKCFLQSWNWLLLLWHFPLLSDIFKRGFHATLNHIVHKGRKMTTLWIFFLAPSEKKNCFFLSGFYIFKKRLTPVTHQSVCWQNLLWCIKATQLNYIQVLKFSKCYLNRISCTLVNPLKMLR